MVRTAALASLMLAVSAPTAAQDAHRLTPAFDEISSLGDGRVQGMSESPDGRLLLYLVGDDQEHLQWRIYERATGRTRSVHTGAAVEIVWSPRGNEVAFSRANDQTRWLHIWTQQIDPNTGDIRGLPRRVSLSQGRGPVWSPDGEWIAFTGLPASDGVSARIVLVRTTGGQERVLVNASGFAQELSWSPDGEVIFYRYRALPGRGDVLLNRVRVSDGSVQSLKRVQGVVKGNGRGRFLAHRPPGERGGDLTISTVDGLEIGRFSLPPTMDVLGWSNRGLKLLAAEVQLPSAMSVSTIAGGPARLLSRGETRDYSPSWSPDSGRLAIVTVLGDRRQLIVQSGLGGARRHIPTRAEPDYSPAIWSPDQRYLGFYSDGGQRLNLVELATGAEAVIAQSLFGVGAAKWRRDGQAMFAAVSTADRTELRETALGGASTVLSQLDKPLRSLQVTFVGDTVVVFGDEKTLRASSLRRVNERVVVAVGDSAAGEWLRGVNVSPDGAFVVLPGHMGPHADDLALRVIGLDGTTRRLVSVPGVQLVGSPFAWHPDGRHVVNLVQARNGRILPYLFPLNGDPPRPLIGDAPGAVSAFALSPDGSAIAYSSVADANTVLWEIDLTRTLAGFEPTGNGR